jgi:hypothetical protein
MLCYAMLWLLDLETEVYVLNGLVHGARAQNIDL